MSKRVKRAILFSFILLIIVALLFFVIVYFVWNDDHYSFFAEYGDRFEVIYDDFTDKSIVTPGKSLNSISELHMSYKGKITERDVIGLKKTSSIKVYKVKDVVIFDDGNGFEKFNENTDLKAHSEVADVVKENLYGDDQLYKRYKKILEKQ